MRDLKLGKSSGRGSNTRLPPIAQDSQGITEKSHWDTSLRKNKFVLQKSK